MYGLFLGCIAPLKYPGIESSTRAVFNELGIEYTDLEGASCCPAPGVTQSFDKKTWLTLGARNLVIAEKNNLDIITICNGCFGSLFEVSHELNHDEKLRDEINKNLGEIGMKYNGKVKVRHFPEFYFKDIGLEKIKSKVKNELNLKVAVHYGCHFLKPSDVMELDNPEKPRMLDDLVEAVGATSIEYRDKMMCCGAGGGVRARAADVSQKMTEEKLGYINDAGADCIVDVCPFCHLQYDLGQKNIKSNIPVIHLNQLYGLAFGVDKAKLGFQAQVIKVNL